MSVEIYTVDEENCELCFAVASERYFNQFWEQAISELKISLLGNGVWLFRRDLAEIIKAFSKVKEWAICSLSEEDADYIVSHIDTILERLPVEWSDYIPRLWMG